MSNKVTAVSKKNNISLVKYTNPSIVQHFQNFIFFKVVYSPFVIAYQQLKKCWYLKSVLILYIYSFSGLLNKSAIISKHWTFQLSCSSELHLQPLYNLMTVNIMLQSKLNAKYYSILPFAIVFHIYTHQHNVLQWLTVYILNPGPVWNKQKHTERVSAQRDKKWEWKTDEWLRKRQKLRYFCMNIVYP